MVAMKEIARACGVSSATVSRARSGRRDICEQTRELICKTAEGLGYMTNSAVLQISSRVCSPISGWPESALLTVATETPQAFAISFIETMLRPLRFVRKFS